MVPIDAKLVRVHAGHLDLLRARLGRLGTNVQRFEQDQAAFGVRCGWILTGLGDRTVRQGELIAYIEETLVLFVQGFARVADGRELLSDMIGMPASSSAVEHPSSEGAAAEAIDDVLHMVARRDWVAPMLAEAAPVAEFAVPVGEGIGVLRAGGLDGAMAGIPPLRQMLDDLTGAPAVVAEQAGHWDVMATELGRIAADLQGYLDRDFAARDRPDVRAYLAIMANNVVALRGLAAAANGMTVVTRAAGDLILLARDIVRGLIGDLVARVLVWVADPVVVPLPVLTARLAAVVVTAWRVDAYITALVVSISGLSRCIDG
ncbi:hypothetical protein [Actinoplanes palleronii]|uniref:Uncharacterized protein n=1 Tax=Actinoplanes palleronii TaxID=113570 RepID=A0ABQ4BNI8_9ACTN|nr:hypothetical protein [Actinoplanes palleronii]GIE72244.1 hypothetical protein Apa02nite_083520 [Actinoplanes palleronii]